MQDDGMEQLIIDTHHTSTTPVMRKVTSTESLSKRGRYLWPAPEF